MNKYTVDHCNILDLTSSGKYSIIQNIQQKTKPAHILDSIAIFFLNFILSPSLFYVLELNSIKIIAYICEVV